MSVEGMEQMHKAMPGLIQGNNTSPAKGNKHNNPPPPSPKGKRQACEPSTQTQLETQMEVGRKKQP